MQLKGDSVICLAVLGFCAKLEIPKIAKLANYSGVYKLPKLLHIFIKHEDNKNYNMFLRKY